MKVRLVSHVVRNKAGFSTYSGQNPENSSTANPSQSSTLKPYANYRGTAVLNAVLVAPSKNQSKSCSIEFLCEISIEKTIQSMA